MNNMCNDSINYIDITEDWIGESKNGFFIVCDGVIIDENKYLVGDNGVYIHEKLRPKDINIAENLFLKYGKQVVLLPEISGSNRNIKMADLIVNGKLVEIKTIDSSGLNTIKNAIKRAKGQANDSIINVGNTLLTLNEIIETIKKQFNNTQCKHMELCAIMKSGNVIKVFKRKMIGTAAMLKHDVAPIIYMYNNIYKLNSQGGL